MSVEHATPQPGWYPNHTGHLQWWDGNQWAQLAPATPTPKDATIAYILAILLGGFGAHRFYLRRPGTAILLLVLWCGGWLLAPLLIGIPMLVVAFAWIIIDLFLIPGMIRTTP